MTPEEMQTALDSALESIAKLEAKNKEIVEREKKAKGEADAARQAAEEAAEEAAAKSGDVEAITKSLETKHAKIVKALQDQLDGANTRLSGMLIDDTITKSLVENNVAKHLHAPLTAMFKAQSSLKDGVAVHGDEALADYLPAFFKSSDGKAFVTAQTNIGTGSTGVRNANVDQWANPPKTAEELDRFGRLSISDPTLYETLKAKGYGQA